MYTGSLAHDILYLIPHKYSFVNLLWICGKHKPSFISHFLTTNMADKSGSRLHVHDAGGRCFFTYTIRHAHRILYIYIKRISDCKKSHSYCKEVFDHVTVDGDTTHLSCMINWWFQRQSAWRVQDYTTYAWCMVV